MATGARTTSGPQAAPATSAANRSRSLPSGTRSLERVFRSGVRVGSGDEWIRLGALKGHIDGIMGTSTARFFEPYSHDPNNRGRWRPLMVNDKGEFVGKFLKYMLDAAPKEFLTTDTLYTIIAGKVVYQNQNPNP